MLRFPPREGSVVFCDYSGFVVPEMVKKRPVVVIHRHKHNSLLVYVVPISSTPPFPMHDYHLQVDQSFSKAHLNGKICWVKCDMINSVSLERLHLIKGLKIKPSPVPYVESLFLARIKDAVRKACGL